MSYGHSLAMIHRLANHLAINRLLMSHVVIKLPARTAPY